MDKKTPNLQARAQHEDNRMFGPLLAPLRMLFTPSSRGLVPEIHLFCENCGKHVSSEADWVCGYCDNDTKENGSNTKYYSFLNRCVACSSSAKAYVCPHCEKLNYLDAHRDDRHAARVLRGKEPAPIVKADPREIKRLEHLARKEDLQQEIEIAALNKRLIQFKNSIEFKQELTEREMLEKKYSAYEENVMGLQMMERRVRLENAKLYSNSPEMLEMKNMALDAFLAQEGLTPRPLSDEEEKGTTV